MNQMTKIMSEVNYDLSQIKLVKCIGCHNEADWIEYVLRNNYEEFDIIRIVEGAVVGRPNSTDDGHSKDNTLELIRNFPDPDNKIQLFTINRHFKSLEEQKQIFIDTASPGEWLVVCDADEFYMEGDVNRIRRAIKKHPLASEIIPTFLHFYRSFGFVRDYEEEWGLWHQRIIKYVPGMRYYTHPVLTLSDGRCTYFTPEMQPHRYMMPDLYVYHYGHAKPHEAHRTKAEFYRSELGKFEGRGGSAADEFDIKLDEFINYKEDISKILRYDGKHPSVLDSHPLRNIKEKFYDDKLIKDFKDSEAYNSRLPTIPQWMKYKIKMQPFYNTVEV